VKCTEVTESDGWRARLQARRQEMEWGFCEKVKNGGCFFCKKVDLSSTQGALCTVSVFFYLTFYLFGGVRTHPTPTGLGYM